MSEWQFISLLGIGLIVFGGLIGYHQGKRVHCECPEPEFAICKISLPEKP